MRATLYKTDEEFLFALGEAMREEYKAVIDSGLVLQLDDPGLPDTCGIWPIPSPRSRSTRSSPWFASRR
jgi:methionine synthase II (cobalamin-independent)